MMRKGMMRKGMGAGRQKGLPRGLGLVWDFLARNV
jgi:hypothetical protein